MKAICRVKVTGIGDSKINNNGLKRRQGDEAWLCLGNSDCLLSMSCCCTPAQSRSHLQTFNNFRGVSVFTVLSTVELGDSKQGCLALAQLLAKLWLSDIQTVTAVEERCDAHGGEEHAL